MGGGRKEFFPNTTSLLLNGTGVRLDGLDLAEKWHEDKVAKNASHQYVTDRAELLKVCTIY